MSDVVSRLHVPRRPVSWVAGTLVVAGLVISSPVVPSPLSWWALLLTGLGTFGPGLLRELGWLRDKDEFQIQAARRAGYHAFLVAGLAAFFWISFLRAAPGSVKDPEELSTFFAALLWFTWLFSSLVNYWGARRTAFRVLVVYGCAWLAFCIADELTNPVGLLMQSLLVLPFFAGAWLSRGWPRSAGVLLLVVSGILLVLLSGIHAQRDLGLLTRAVTLLLFVGPLLASGIALLARPQAEEG